MSEVAHRTLRHLHVRCGVLALPPAHRARRRIADRDTRLASSWSSLVSSKGTSRTVGCCPRIEMHKRCTEPRGNRVRAGGRRGQEAQLRAYGPDHAPPETRPSPGLNPLEATPCGFDPHPGPSLSRPTRWGTCGRASGRRPDAPRSTRGFRTRRSPLAKSSRGDPTSVLSTSLQHVARRAASVGASA
jgi:hypothetical protein